MKMKIVLALFLLGILATVIAKDQVLEKKVEGASSNKVATSAAATTATKAEVVPKNQKASKGGKFHNSIGQKVNKKMILDSFPFKVKRCDQIVVFKAKYISDMGDYRFRKDGFFTITAYYVNQFRDKNAAKLDESILLTESKNQAQHLKGARGCVYIDGGRFRNDIAICLANKGQAQNILNVLNDFARCRMGDNLQPIPIATLRKLIRACGKNGKWKKPGKKGAKNGAKKAAKKKLNYSTRGKNAWREDRKKYFHPLKLRVPGTRR